MQCFEYLAAYVNSSGAYQAASGTWKDLKELGEQGWELVSVVNESGDLIGFFKKLKDCPSKETH